MSNYYLVQTYLNVLTSCYGQYKDLSKELEGFSGERKRTYQGKHPYKVQSWMIDRIFPMDAELLDRMEKAFGYDFKNVRLHTGIKASSITGELGAQAVTMGNDIYFASGAFDPYGEEGLKLLAHELVHVKQFGGGNSPVTGEDREALEGEAYRMEQLIGESFHNLDRGDLDDTGMNRFSQQGRAGGLRREAGGDGPDLLDDFTNESRTKDREIIMENSGRVYRLSPEEVNRAKQEAIKAFKVELGERFYIAGTEERINLIEKLKAGGFGQ